MGDLKKAIDIPLDKWATVNDLSNNITTKYIIPLLQNSDYYDRLTGYFSFQSLSIVSQGIHTILNSDGKMRLVMGLHDLKPDIEEGYLLSKEMAQSEIDNYFDHIMENWESLKKSIEYEDIRTLACLLSKEKLEIKVAIPKNSYDGEGYGIFHNKLLIFRNNNSDYITASGSPNETVRGLSQNGEILDFNRSWIEGESWHAMGHIKQFEEIWNDSYPAYYVFDLPYAIKEKIINDFYKITKLIQKDKINPNLMVSLIRWTDVLFKNSDFWPYCLGPIYLFPHQVKNIEISLNRYPLRILIADEVGLGKTISAGGIIKKYFENNLLNRFILLAPANLVFQWQRELKENFGINTFAYNTKDHCYYSAEKNREYSSGPYHDMPNGNIILSWHLIRGHKDEFYNIADKFDMLIIDEAHNARIYRDDKKKSGTLLYNLLNDAKYYFKDIILLTATPVQTDIVEALGLMKLLGLGGNYWSNIDNFEHYYLTIDKKLKQPDNLIRILNGIRWYRNYFLTDVEFDSIINKIQPPIFGQYDQAIIKEDIIKFLNCKDIDRELGTLLQYDEDILRLMVLFSPLHNLMIRNTRESLEELGYRFPERCFEDILLSQEISEKDIKPVEDNIDKLNAYFDINVSKTLSFIDINNVVGFTKSVYHQRLCSSLYSVYITINNRKNIINNILYQYEGYKERLKEVYRTEEKDEKWGKTGATFSNDIQIDDELLLKDLEDDYYDQFDNVDQLLEISSDDREFEANKNLARSYREILKELVYENKSLERSLREEIIAVESMEKDLIYYYNSPEKDPKIKICVDILNKYIIIGHKILFFSKYKDTIYGFVKALKNIGQDMSTIATFTGDGGIVFNDIGEETFVDKSEITKRLDEGLLNVLLCTDAASEGLNLQSADMEVHIDIPWNPAKLEQRIGRIDRLGQIKERVYIKNLWYPNQENIEYKMLNALITRLGFSKITIGPVQSIISNAFEKLVSNNENTGDIIKTAIREIEKLNESSLYVFQSFKNNIFEKKPTLNKNENMLALSLLKIFSRAMERELIIQDNKVLLKGINLPKELKNNHIANSTPGKKNYLTLAHPLIITQLDELKDIYKQELLKNDQLVYKYQLNKSGIYMLTDLTGKKYYNTELFLLKIYELINIINSDINE